MKIDVDECIGYFEKILKIASEGGRSHYRLAGIEGYSKGVIEGLKIRKTEEKRRKG